MKKRIVMGMAFLILVSAGVACKKKSTPAAPVTPPPAPTETPCGWPVATCTPTNTPTATNTPVPGVWWYLADVDRSIGYTGTTTQSLYLWLQVDGVPVSTALVTFSYAGTTVTLPYTGWVSTGGNFFGNYENDGTGWTYTPGQACTFTTVTGPVTAQEAVTLPGGITNAADGSSASWTVEGTSDNVLVADSAAFTIILYSSVADVGSDLVSPASIPASIYPTPGTYYMRTAVQKNTHDLAANTTYSWVRVFDQRYSYVTRP